MQQSGQEMLDETISTCKSNADGLATQNQDWENSVIEIVEIFDEVRGTFFFQTMHSDTVTRNAMRAAH